MITTKTLLVILLVSIVKTQDFGSKAKCFWVNGQSVFDLSKLNSKNDSIIGDTKNGLITYNFCSNVNKTCSNNASQMAYSNSKQECNRLEGNINNYNSWELINKTNSTEGIMITFNAGDKCNSHENYVLKMTLRCDKSQKGLKFIDNNDLFNNSICQKSIIANSIEACPNTSYFTVANFVDQYKIFVGIAFLLIGGYMALLGSKFESITIFVGTVLMICMVGMILFYNVIKINAEWSIWVVLGISAAIGVVVGFFLASCSRVFFSAFGAFLGYCLGNLFYNFALNKIDGNQDVIFWVTIGAFMGVAIIVSCIFYEVIILISTSFVGAYMIIRGISYFAGGFPNESVIIELSKKGETEELNSILTWRIYMYLSSIIVLFILSWIGQWYFFKRTPSEENNQNSGEILVKTEK